VKPADSPRLLVVRLGSLGDLVHTLPAVATLRAAFPAARIDWLIEARWQELLELNPDVTSLIPANTLAWRRALLAADTWHSFRELVRALRRARYDLALDFQGLYKSALATWLSAAPRRLGFERDALKEAGAARFYTERVGVPAGAHVVENYLALARAAGAGTPAIRFPLPTRPEDDAAVAALLAEHHLENFFIISPGGGWGAKCWPIERYAQLHNALARERGWRCVLNAAPNEQPLVNEFMSQARVAQPVHLRLAPRQLAALIRRARLLVSGDTGPLHLAAAVGTPLVGLYGPTDPARNGPYVGASGRGVVLHHPEAGPLTYKHDDRPSPAMLAITVEEALGAVNCCLEAAGG
jgi:lipopolysaccharide heptosyltransferase I